VGAVPLMVHFGYDALETADFKALSVSERIFDDLPAPDNPNFAGLLLHPVICIRWELGKVLHGCYDRKTVSYSH